MTQRPLRSVLGPGARRRRGKPALASRCLQIRAWPTPCCCICGVGHTALINCASGVRACPPPAAPCRPLGHTRTHTRTRSTPAFPTCRPLRPCCAYPRRHASARDAGCPASGRQQHQRRRAGGLTCGCGRRRPSRTSSPKPAAALKSRPALAHLLQQRSHSPACGAAWGEPLQGRLRLVALLRPAGRRQPPALPPPRRR